MDSSVSPKDDIWFLRVCRHISTGLYEKERFTAVPDKLKVRSGLGSGVAGGRLSIELWEIEVKFVPEEEKHGVL